ncbi:MAG: hypothetical protein HZB65_00705 [Candidatus Aenigmarchaeota archaeon]|nr:hypothetical protein [Candidatus Aenigmarchaeota archaeon]
MIEIYSVTPLTKKPLFGNEPYVRIPSVVPGMTVGYNYIDVEHVPIDKSRDIEVLNKELLDVEKTISDLQIEWNKGVKCGGIKSSLGYREIITPDNHCIRVSYEMIPINQGLCERWKRKQYLIDTIEKYGNFAYDKKAAKTGQSIVVRLEPVYCDDIDLDTTWVNSLFTHCEEVKWKAYLSGVSGAFDVEQLTPGGFDKTPEFRSQEYVTVPTIKKINQGRKAINTFMNIGFRQLEAGLKQSLGEEQPEFLVDLRARGDVVTIRTEAFGKDYEAYKQQFIIVSPTIIAPENGSEYRIFLTRPDNRGLFAVSSKALSRFYYQPMLTDGNTGSVKELESGEFRAMPYIRADTREE